MSASAGAAIDWRVPVEYADALAQFETTDCAAAHELTRAREDG